MRGTAKPPSAHDQTTDQAGNNQAITHGWCKPQQGMISHQHLQLLTGQAYYATS